MTRSEIDEFLDGLDAGTRATFEHIRQLATDIVPDAEEGTSYGMPALKYKKRPLLISAYSRSAPTSSKRSATG